MSTVATTIGTGPFLPAIQVDGVTYVLSDAPSFKNEDDAFVVARTHADALYCDIQTYLAKYEFVRYAG